MDYSRNDDGAGRQGTPDTHSRWDTLAQWVIALAAAAALVVSCIGLVLSMKSADAAAQANKLAEQAASSAAQSEKSAQADKVSYEVDTYPTTTNSGNQYFARLYNHSTNNIRHIFLIYGETAAGPLYYENIGVLGPCKEWEAQEDQEFWQQVYFEDSAGNYWMIDSSLNLRSLAGPRSLNSLTDKTSAWSPQYLSISSGC